MLKIRTILTQYDISNNKQLIDINNPPYITKNNANRHKIDEKTFHFAFHIKTQHRVSV